MSTGNKPHCAVAHSFFFWYFNSKDPIHCDYTMSPSSKLYEPERLEKIGNIMSRFRSNAKVGDEIEFGLKGDPEFPKEYLKDRPYGRIIRVKAGGTDNASLKVRMNTGRVVVVPPHSVDKSRVWEFSDAHFPKVLERIERESPTEYRGSDYGKESDYQLLIRKVNALSNQVTSVVEDRREFDRAVVESISAMSGELADVNPHSSYASSFSKEFRSSHKESVDPSPFDSDFSDD